MLTLSKQKQKQKHKQLLAVISLLLAIVSGSVLSAETKVLVLLSGESDIYRSLLLGLQSTTAATPETTITFVARQVDDENAKEVRWDNYAVIVSVGTKAARQLLKVPPKTPVLSVLVPKTTYESLLHDSLLHEKGGEEKGRDDLGPDQTLNRFSVIYVDQPYSREFVLARKLVPDLRSIGVLLGPNSSKNLPQLKEEARRHQLILNKVEVDETRQDNRDIRDLVRESNVILAIPDPVAFNAQRAKWLLYQAYQQRVAVIAFSKSYVDAGALAAVYSTPEQIGRHAGEVLQAMLRDPNYTAHSDFPKYFSITVNDSVAKSMHLQQPDLEQLRQEISQAELLREQRLGHGSPE